MGAPSLGKESKVMTNDDRPGGKSIAIVGVAPGKPTLVAGLLPKANHIRDRFDGFPPVQDHSLAVGFDLLAAPELSGCSWQSHSR